MYAPRVFISMLGVLVAFAVSSYLMSGSAFTAFIQTLICAVVIQAGYFIGVVYLVRREKLLADQKIPPETVARRARSTEKRDELHANAATNFPASDG
jgi:hypothetical protein